MIKIKSIFKRSSNYKTYGFNFIGYFGLLSSIILIICLYVSINDSPWFNWTENWLSELAGTYGMRPIWTANGTSAIFFNGGLILSGLIGLLFSILINKIKIFKSKSGRLLPLLISIDMIGMSFCGIFPATTGEIHKWFSLLFLGAIPIIILLTSFEIRKIYGNKWWLITNIFCSIVFLSFGFFAFMPRLHSLNRAIAETILIFSVFILIDTLSLKIIRNNISIKSSNNHKIKFLKRNIVFNSSLIFL